jgi:hypothetical protein
MRRSLLSTTLILILSLSAAPAMADVIDPAEEACRSKAKDASCNADQPGTCQDGECCRNDYSNGVPPSTVCSPCLVCKPGTSGDKDMASAPDSAPDSGAGEPTPEDKSGCAAAGPGSLGMWSILGGLVALGSLRRRRPQA